MDQIMQTLTSKFTPFRYEFPRIKIERLQWDVDRVKSQAKIAVLLGERKGQESLESDLICRITIHLHLAKLMHRPMSQTSQMKNGIIQNGIVQSDEQVVLYNCVHVGMFAVRTFLFAIQNQIVRERFCSLYKTESFKVMSK